MDFNGSDGKQFAARTYGISEAAFPAFSRSWLQVPYEREPDAVNARLSYLLGAHIHYGIGQSFKFANSMHKVELIIGFLEVLGAQRIHRSWTVGGAPAITEIRFEPGPGLKRLFDSGLALLKKEHPANTNP